MWVSCLLRIPKRLPPAPRASLSVFFLLSISWIQSAYYKLAALSVWNRCALIFKRGAYNRSIPSQQRVSMCHSLFNGFPHSHLCCPQLSHRHWLLLVSPAQQWQIANDASKRRKNRGKNQPKQAKELRWSISTSIHQEERRSGEGVIRHLVIKIHWSLFSNPSQIWRPKRAICSGSLETVPITFTSLWISGEKNANRWPSKAATQSAVWLTV